MKRAHILGVSAGILFMELQKFFESGDFCVADQSLCVAEVPTHPTAVTCASFLGTAHTES